MGEVTRATCRRAEHGCDGSGEKSVLKLGLRLRDPADEEVAVQTEVSLLHS